MTNEINETEVTTPGELLKIADSTDITLRDHYAAAALTGMLATGYMLNQYNEDQKFKYIEAAFRIADDMITERQRTR